MVVRRSFEWDVLKDSSPNAWFDELGAQGWTRVPSSPGVSTRQGTVIYEFEHLGPASEAEPAPGPPGYRAITLILLASGAVVAVMVAAVLVVLSIAMS